MQKRIVSVAVCLVLSVLAAAPARAEAPVQGSTFMISLTGLPNDIYQCQTVRATISISVYNDGTTARKPALITTWIETPLGRAVLNQQSRQLLPGHTTSVSTSFASPCPGASSVGGSSSVTLGVTVTIKNETLETSHEMV